MNAIKMLGSGLAALGLTCAIVAALAAPGFADQTRDKDSDMTNASQINYGVLADSRMDHFAIRRAQMYGCGDEGVAKLERIAHEAGVPMNELVDRVETGVTIPNLSLEYGVSMPNADGVSTWKHRVWEYETAYRNTGARAYQGMHTDRVAGWAENMSDRGSRGIVETLDSAGDFSILVRALRSTGVAATLRAGGPYTLFAPTNEAFGKLPNGTLDALMANPTQLATILQFHVVAGRIMNSDIVAMISTTTPNTLQGTPLTVVTNNGVTTINNWATITRPDIRTRDGVIHGIDGVLLPPGTTLPVAP